MRKVSLVVAAYNEAQYIERCLHTIAEQTFSNWDLEVIVVNDGSTDATQHILTNCQKRYSWLRVEQLPQNLGKGNAIKHAAQLATGTVVVIQDADLEYAPSDIHAILAEFSNPKTAVVYGSRVLGEVSYGLQTSSCIYYAGGRLLSAVMNVLFQTKITDQATCYKAWKGSVTPAILQHCPSNGFEFEIELTAFFAKQGFEIREVPIQYFPRSKSSGKKIGLSDFFKSVATAFRCYQSN